MADTREIINGYRLRSHLQTGAVSQVWEVIEVVSNRHFAMKLLLPESAGKSEVRSMLFNEAEVGIKLRHENVINIVKVSKDEHTPHFIMEFFPSGALRSKLIGNNKDMAFLKENNRKIFRQASTALAYMHSNGWVHCDVKADNLLVNAAGQLRLIDFAISKRVPTGFAKWFYRRGKAQGTPSFMAPEQARSEMPDPRSDIYSLGATFYELLTGRPPFRGSSVQDLLEKQVAAKPDSPQMYNPDVSDEMSALVLKMLAKKKEARPQTCHDVMIALRKIKIYKSQPIPPEEAM